MRQILIDGNMLVNRRLRKKKKPRERRGFH